MGILDSVSDGVVVGRCGAADVGVAGGIDRDGFQFIDQLSADEGGVDKTVTSGGDLGYEAVLEAIVAGLKGTGGDGILVGVCGTDEEEIASSVDGDAVQILSEFTANVGGVDERGAGGVELTE